MCIVFSWRLAIRRVLRRLYPDPPIPLDHDDAFTLLIAVVLSAQCTDVAVNKSTPALFERGGTPQAMSRLRVNTIRTLIATLGLAPTKARNIHALSKLLLERHQGRRTGSYSSSKTVSTHS